MAETFGVLLVTASPDEAQMYRDYGQLSAADFRVEVSEPAGAATRAVEFAADVVVTDLVLPYQSDGIALIEQFRGDSRLRHVGIIVVTGWTALDDLNRAHDAGCDSLCFKPMPPDEVWQEIRRVATSARARNRQFCNPQNP